MKKLKKGCLIFMVIVLVSLTAILIFVPDVINALKFFSRPKDQFWFDSLCIDTEIELSQPVEHTDNGYSFNGKEYIEAEDYNYEAVKHLPMNERPNVDMYYIEDSYLGCYSSANYVAAFGTSEDDVDFLLLFGESPLRHYRWYVDENYVFPSISKDEVSSLLIMKSESMEVAYELSAFDRVKQSEATAKITDRTVIDDVIKNENYDVLNEYIEDDEPYVVLAQFDGHIIYETITVLNDANL